MIGTPSEEDLDEFEDDEDKPRKQRKIDEYHVLSFTFFSFRV